MDTVARLLKDHKDILERISLDLLEKETIVLKDMEEIIEELRPGQFSDRMTKKKAEKPQPQPVKETVLTKEPVVEAEQAATSEPVDTVSETKEEPSKEKKNDPEAP